MEIQVNKVYRQGFLLLFLKAVNICERKIEFRINISIISEN